MSTIESQDMTLEKLFDEFYVIPDYQREYVWAQKEVNEFIQDIYEEFSEQIQNSYPVSYTHLTLPTICSV